ncbi:HIT domain-containing protein [Pseudonocardia sediminis]|uniref:HIT domain-containing protein n=1 Tax=Pseudonocardia sediminis TaxID=1397368 RepID=A0A4Q7V2P3_PSEST|nr:HIT family protein [Pseudonocardia sediminis]RZT87754.1 HIT domain-containing protein [Pseudonocardia sediminis]
MDDCVFCRIVAGTATADLVAETARVVAFCDIAPITPGHLLVVPRAHGSGLADVSDDDAAAMTVLARRLAVALRDTGLRLPGPERRPGPTGRWRRLRGHRRTGTGGGRHGGRNSDIGGGSMTGSSATGGGRDREGAPITGTNLFLADGVSAGQEVFHAHLHVIPRYAGDGVRLRTGERTSTPDERAEVAERVRAALGDG